MSNPDTTADVSDFHAKPPEASFLPRIPDEPLPPARVIPDGADSIPYYVVFTVGMLQKMLAEAKKMPDGVRAFYGEVELQPQYRVGDAFQASTPTAKQSDEIPF